MIGLSVEKLLSGGVNKPVWLWWSGTGADPQEIDRCWQAFLRRFDVEHTFRLLQQTRGWTRPKLRDPQAADRWTCLVLAAHTQLRLARPLAPASHSGPGASASSRGHGTDPPFDHLLLACPRPLLPKLPGSRGPASVFVPPEAFEPWPAPG